MEQGTDYKQQLITEYKQEVWPLLRYLPWLEKSAGSTVSTTYNGQDIGEHSVSFPVYDGTLLSFVKEASRTGLMEKNYPYIYTRNGIRTHEDERRVINATEWKDWDTLKGILSKYVLGGQTKATLWNEAVEQKIFYLVLKRMKEIIEYWDKPIDQR